MAARNFLGIVEHEFERSLANSRIRELGITKEKENL
jgi:hypothetical protein